jgi:hypothetical protein
MTHGRERVFLSVFGIVFLVIVVLVPRVHLGSDSLSYYALRVGLSLAAAGLAIFLPGSLNVSLPGGTRAGGALAVFALVFWKAPDFVQSPPAPDSGNVVIKDGFRWPGDSGFVFADQTQVDWYSHQADLLAARPPDSDLAQFFIQHDMPPYTSPSTERAFGGIRRINETDLQKVNKCPVEGYVYAYQSATPTQIYCLVTRDGKHYAALRVNEVTADRIDFSYIYQSSGAPTF